MYYFGEPWDDPQLLEMKHCGVPVGVPCEECRTPVLPGEQGLLLSEIKPRRHQEGYWVDLYSRHRECHLLVRMNAQDGQCHHIYGCTRPEDRRRSALALWERLRGS